MIYLIIALIILILLVTLYLIRKKYAIKKTKSICEEEKMYRVNAALSPFGFEFDNCEDIVISKSDSWQRDVGYTDLYDYKAPLFNMVFDAAPIFFDYDCKHYRVEFWKGQYGILTGCEAGVYVRDNNSTMPEGFYRAASKCEELEIGFKLYKNCRLFERCGTSWWLTGFDFKTFSNPKDLSMRICVTFPNEDMERSFINGLIDAGYSKCNIDVLCKTVCFDFCCPFNYKPNYCKKILKSLMQIFNFINSRLFLWFTRPFNRSLDKLVYLSFLAPHIYNLIICVSIPRRRNKKYYKKYKKHFN